MPRRPPLTVHLCAALLLCGLGLLAPWAPALAQPVEVRPPAGAPLPPGVPELSPEAEASLLTMLPGREVYSLFGHSAFRVFDPATGLDKTYNYGTFDFNQPFFLVRFARGQLDYILDTGPMDREVQRYYYMGRPIIEQPLALPPDAIRALYVFLETNALPENRAYRYDFLFDNCSTRLLGALDHALVQTGRPPLALPPAPGAPAGWTFREQLRPYLRADPLVRLGTDLGLGLPTDRRASVREGAFLPLELARLLDGATWQDGPGGPSLVLVASRDTLFWVDGAGTPREAFPWPLAFGWALFALALGATLAGQRGHIPALWGRRADALLFAVAGAAGLIMAVLWLGTEHRVTGPNLNLLWAWPTHLAAWGALRRADLGTRWRRYLGAAAVLTGLVALAWPFWPQVLPAAALPLALLLALRAGVRARRPALQPA